MLTHHSRRRRRKRILWQQLHKRWLLGLIFLAWPWDGVPYSLAAQVPAPVFDNEPEGLSESGYYKLSWHWDADLLQSADQRFELEQAPDQAFEQATVLYQGPDLATFLSGMEDGPYYYRVRAITPSGTSPWSAPVYLEVRHHPLSLALTLFGIGALVFLLTVGIVIMGVRHTKMTSV